MEHETCMYIVCGTCMKHGCKVVGGSGLSHEKLGQLGPGTGRVVVGSGRFPGCPGLSHGNLGQLPCEY